MSTPRTRHKARRLAVQALYQWQLAGENIGEIEQQFLEDNGDTNFDRDYFHQLLHGIPAKLDEIDAALTPHMTRAIESVDPVERAILRLACWELLARPDIPYRVVINEAIELAKTFGATDGHKFVNGVLDKAAGKLRAIEVSATRKL
ncbi:MAG: transcription antitermination factor NusB [Gammaproteobacteria bacterium]|nr:MAG: transcription antitermination factor NusB [Gammaproteobacteria bacterium]